MTTFVDNFTGTDGTDIASHTSDSGATWINTWAQYGTGYADIHSNACYGHAAATYKASANTASADGTFTCTITKTSSGGGSAGLAFRVTGGLNTASGYVITTDGSNWQMYKYNSGWAPTAIGSPVAQALTAGLPYRVKVVTAGTSLKYYTDDGAGGAYVLRDTITDSTYSSVGSLGFMQNNPSNLYTTGLIIDSMAEVAAAANVTMTGPTSGLVSVASTNFTVGADGTITGTVVVTPSDSGAGGTFTPTTVSISSGSPTGTFTYTPASTGNKTISVTNNGSLSNPSNITYSSQTAATAVTLTGPTSGTVSTASTNFTVGANGSITGTVVVTPSSGGGGGTFTPTTISISNGSPTGTFTYTPASTGTKTISLTNNGSLTNPSNITYTSNAAPATAVTMTGPTSGTAGSASSNFTVGANGAITGTVVCTPSDGGTGGAFSPTTVSISAASPTATFTYIASANGAKTISLTNNGSLTVPSNITYTAGGSTSLVAGAASFVSSTSTTINSISTAGSGGSGTLTYQWYRGTTPDFAVGSGTLLSGATSLTLADSSSVLPDIPYYYLCRVTDGASSTADSFRSAGVLLAPTVAVGFIGDSITYGTGATAGKDAVSQFALMLAKLYKNRSVMVVNRAIEGTTSGMWVNQTADWAAAKGAFAAAGVTHVHMMLGANDSRFGVPAASYKPAMQTLINDLVSSGYKVIVCYPSYISPFIYGSYNQQAYVACLQSYLAQIDSLIDGVNVIRGDTLAYNYFINHQSELQDGLHPNDAGYLTLATLWARAFDRNVFGMNKPPYTRTVTKTFKSESPANTLKTNLTGLKWEWADVQGQPIDSGTGATTDASGVMTITVHTYLGAGGIGHLSVTNESGTVNTSYLSYNGPTAVT